MAIHPIVTDPSSQQSDGLTNAVWRSGARLKSSSLSDYVLRGAIKQQTEQFTLTDQTKRLTLPKCQPENGCLFSCQMRSFSSFPMSGVSTYNDFLNLLDNSGGNWKRKKGPQHVITMNLSSWPCSKLSELFSSLISSDLPFCP